MKRVENLDELNQRAAMHRPDTQIMIRFTVGNARRWSTRRTVATIVELASSLKVCYTVVQDPENHWWTWSPRTLVMLNGPAERVKILTAALAQL